MNTKAPEGYCCKKEIIWTICFFLLLFKNVGQANFSWSTTVVNKTLSYRAHSSCGPADTATGLLTFV